MEELIEAFRAFDEHDCGYLTDEQFATLLTEWGEPMPVEEAHASLRHEGVIESNKVFYRKFVEVLLERH